MAKNKGKSKDTRKGAKKRDNGSAEINRAETRLTKALAGVDDARGKVARRERDLAALMKRHGRTAVLESSATEAAPLEASSQGASDNGTADTDAEANDRDTVKGQTEQPAMSDGAAHHG